MSVAPRPATQMIHGKPTKNPMHVHLTHQTPLHVHVDRPKKPPARQRCGGGDARIYSVINRQRQEHQALQRQKTHKNNSQGCSSEPETPEEVLVRKEEGLKRYECKLKEIEEKNTKLLDNIESLCSALENNGDCKVPVRLRQWAVLVKDLAFKIEAYDALLKSYKADRLGGPSNAQTEELSRTNMDISTDLHELHHVIRCVGVELGRLADKQEGPVWECSGGGHTLQHLNSELESLRRDLSELEGSNSCLQAELKRTKDELLLQQRTANTLRDSRAHLQRQLHNKEADLNRATSRINSLEQLMPDVHRCNGGGCCGGGGCGGGGCKSGGKSGGKGGGQIGGKDSCGCGGGGANDERQSLKKAARLYKERWQEGEGRLAEARKHLEQRSQEVAELQRQLQQSDQQVNLLNSKMNGGEGNNNSNNKDVFKLNEAMERLRAKVAEDDGLRERLSHSQEVCDSLQQQNGKLKEEIGSHVRKLEALQHDLDMTKRQNEEEIKKINRKFENAPATEATTSHQDFSHKLMSLERRLGGMEEEKKDLERQNEKLKRSLELKEGERSKELQAVQKQMEMVEEELRKVKETEKDRVQFLERDNRMRRSEWEGQVEELKQNISKMQRDKEEGDRRNVCKLGDLRERLEQCNSTNRTLQHYIHFLKTSYSAAFNEPLPSICPQQASLLSNLV